MANKYFKIFAHFFKINKWNTWEKNFPTNNKFKIKKYYFKELNEKKWIKNILFSNNLHCFVFVCKYVNFADYFFFSVIFLFSFYFPFVIFCFYFVTCFIPKNFCFFYKFSLIFSLLLLWLLWFSEFLCYSRVLFLFWVHKITTKIQKKKIKTIVHVCMTFILASNVIQI